MAQGKSSTCNSGLPGAKKAATLVQEAESTGDAELVWKDSNIEQKYNETYHNRI